MDTSSLDGAGGSYLDNSIERRCQEWQASEYYNSTDSCPCLDDPDAQGQVRRTRREQRFFFVFPETLPTHPSEYVTISTQRFRIRRPASGRVMT